MRDILFRGKRVRDGEWEFGSFVSPNMITAPMGEEIYGSDIVDPETVGEYTGLTDKNGNCIFEGDIVRLYDTWGEWRAVVEFGNPNGVYTWGWQLKPISKTDASTDILCWVEMEEAGAFCEVIGNKWDNPELLKVNE